MILTTGEGLTYFASRFDAAQMGVRPGDPRDLRDDTFFPVDEDARPPIHPPARVAL